MFLSEFHRRCRIARDTLEIVVGLRSFELLPCGCGGPLRACTVGGETITYLPAVGNAALAVTTEELGTIEFSRVRPVRGCPSFKGKRRFTGEWWCATTHRHVTFESWVERDFLIDADFNFRLCGIAAQLFRLRVLRWWRATSGTHAGFLPGLPTRRI